MRRKRALFRKSSAEAFDQAFSGRRDLFQPLSFKYVSDEDGGWSGDVEATWKDRQWEFLVRPSDSTPKAIHEALREAHSAEKPVLITAPFLSEDRLRLLESSGVSGIDACGNGVVIVAPELYVFRSGAPNAYPTSALIKNVYRRRSSLVARTFLLRSSFTAVRQILDVARSNGASITLPTVSKCLKALEEDMIVGRSAQGIKLLQPEKLLSRLAENFQPIVLRRRFVGKVDLDMRSIVKRVKDLAAKTRNPMCISGYSGAAYYASGSQSDSISMYASSIAPIIRDLKAVETSRFPNLILNESHDEIAFFDVRSKKALPIASPIQIYLELNAGDHRDQEAAAGIRRSILASLKEPK